MKLGICAWVLPHDLKGVFDLAKELGLDGVEVDYGGFDKDELIQLRETYNIEVPTMAMNIFCDKGMSKVIHEAYVKSSFEGAIDLAHELGIKKLQVPSFIDGFINNEEELVQTIKMLKYACAYAKQYDLPIGTENAVDTVDNKRMLKEIDSELLFTYFDTANPHVFSGFDSVEMAKELKGTVKELHAKDAHDNSNRTLRLGEGDTSFDETLAVFVSAGFDGYIFFESDYSQFVDYVDVMKDDIMKVRTAFSK